MSFSRILECGNCGQQNRVPARYLHRMGKCGKCKEALGPLSEPVDVNEADFDGIVGEAGVPVLVDFWAEWCGPCRMVAPEVKALAAEMAGKAIVLKVDSDRNPGLSLRYQVQSIPNLLVFREGKLVRQQPGAVGRSVMRGWLEE